MKNLFFVKESAWAIITTLIIIAIYFIAIGFGADKESVLAVAALAAVFAVVAVVAVVVSIIAGKEELFSFGKIFFSLIVFLILAGIGMYFVFSGNYLPGFVLVGAGISFLIILNTLDIVVQFSREPSIFAKKARRAGSYE